MVQMIEIYTSDQLNQIYVIDQALTIKYSLKKTEVITKK